MLTFTLLSVPLFWTQSTKPFTVFSITGFYWTQSRVFNCRQKFPTPTLRKSDKLRIRPNIWRIEELCQSCSSSTVGSSSAWGSSTPSGHMFESLLPFQLMAWKAGENDARAEGPPAPGQPSSGLCSHSGRESGDARSLGQQQKTDKQNKRRRDRERASKLPTKPEQKSRLAQFSAQGHAFTMPPHWMAPVCHSLVS